jgi:hypothetical protein
VWANIEPGLLPGTMRHTRSRQATGIVRRRSRSICHSVPRGCAQFQPAEIAILRFQRVRRDRFPATGWAAHRLPFTATLPSVAAAMVGTAAPGMASRDNRATIARPAPRRRADHIAVRDPAPSNRRTIHRGLAHPSLSSVNFAPSIELADVEVRPGETSRDPVVRCGGCPAAARSMHRP